MRQSIIVISNLEDNTYFFSTDHCQKHNLGNNFVPCTHGVPSYAAPRESLPDGMIKNVKDLVAVFYDDMQEIPNPDPSFQPVFNH